MVVRVRLLNRCAAAVVVNCIRAVTVRHAIFLHRHTDADRSDVNNLMLFCSVQVWSNGGFCQCARCGETFRAQCDVEPVGCPLVWFLLMLSVALHVVRCCAHDSDDGSDDDIHGQESSMYT